MSENGHPYHHGDLRAALVDAGLEATRGGGPDALLLREVTRRVGVSPAAAYRHFADRDALLDAVADEILRRVADTMRAVRPRAAGSSTVSSRLSGSARLRAVGLGYIRFARSEPGWFSVAFFGANAGPVGDPAPGPYVELTSALDEMVREGVLDPQRRAGAQWVCWSAVHGLAELVLRGPLRGMSDGGLDELAARTVDAIIAGVVATP